MFLFLSPCPSSLSLKIIYCVYVCSLVHQLFCYVQLTVLEFF